MLPLVPQSLRRLFWCSACLLGLATGPCLAQSEQATQLVSATNVTQAAEAVDGSAATAAQMTPPASGLSQLRMGFVTPIAPGTKAAVLLQPVGLLNVSALNNLTINTYAPADAGSMAQQESFQMHNLVTLAALNNGQPVAVQFPVSKSFTEVEVIATGLANATYTMGVYNVVGTPVTTAPLPVELVAFAGQAKATGVDLRWQTASEHNSAYFVVERSATGQGNFQPLGQLAGAGTSAQTLRYTFTDPAPTAVNYYRLRQVDRDGQQTFSPVVVVQEAGLRLQAYPSPASDALTVTGAAGARLVVLNQQGQQVQQMALTTYAQQVSLSALPEGVYWIRDEATGQRARFVKAPN